MTHPLLQSAQLKLDRGRKHLNELESCMQEWPKTLRKPPITYTTAIEGRGKGRKRVTRFDSVEPLPPEWGLIAGDAAHNARCALDHWVCALARLNGATSVATNSFPVYSRKPDDERFEDMKTILLANLRSEHRDMIIDMQPYRKKNSPRDRMLTALALIDNMDKHQTVTVSRARRRSVVGEDLPGVEPYVMVVKGQEKPRLNFPKDTLVEAGRKAWWTSPNASILQVPFFVEPVFGEPRVTLGELREIHDEVARIIENVVPDFERFAPTT